MSEIDENLSFFKQKLGIDHNYIVKSYINIQKMAWEQVLLLSFYSRQQCYDITPDSDATGVMARMKLIHAAYAVCNKSIQQENESFNDYGLLNLVLELLDNRKGSVEIIQVLLEHRDNKWSEECNNLLHLMEKNFIAFTFPTFWTAKSVYSHYAQYIALSNPISLFQPLLSIPDITNDEVFKGFLLNYLKTYAQKKYGVTYPYFAATSEDDMVDVVGRINSITSLKEYIDTNPDFIDKDDFSLGFKAYLMAMLGDMVNNSFEQVKSPTPEKRSYGFDGGVFRRMCKSTSANGSLTLTFDENTLRELAQLGLIDEVLRGVKSDLLDTLNPRPRNPFNTFIPSDDYSRAFDELSDWYLSCKTDLFKKLEQVPRLVATIVALDIKHRQGFFSVELGCGSFKKIPKKFKAEDVALITTNIIYHCLFNNYNHQYYTYMTLQSDEYTFGLEENTKLSKIFSKVNDRLTEHKDSRIIEFESRLMTNWQDVESLSSAIERIKKLPAHLRVQGDNRKKSKGTTIYDKIYEQRRNGIICNTPYPITTSIPLPLWVSYQADACVQDNQVNSNSKVMINETESGTHTNTASSGDSTTGE
ncbi:hypothetical protein MWT71_003412 [Vibrio parahaemolyticus]|nr:hypothetical protein [Vibrio parahaemolyticus]EHH1248582.1 hypothetical protein [Vibrio parahaemolyticus]EHW0631856.1 hypothetical protein [Vibrio parahaemolyticus]EJA3304315.1 hypothetical protein [Vibrio parahaemolyticus]EJG0665282.1 hypothetical protein [Vibrio parahaemolyticus]